MTTIYSLWTAEDQKTLEELVRKRGFADTTLALRNIAFTRRESIARTGRKGVVRPGVGPGGKPIDYTEIIGLLTSIYDHIKEGRPLP